MPMIDHRKAALLIRLKDLESEGYQPSRCYSLEDSEDALVAEITRMIKEDPRNLCEALRICVLYIAGISTLTALAALTLTFTA